MDLPNTIYADDMPDFMWNLTVALIEGPYDAALEACKPVAYQAVRDNFTSSATPDNNDWPARKILGDGHPLLIETGAMLQAATGAGPGAESEIGRDGMGGHELAIGIDSDVIPYWKTHQYGDPSRNIPQREFGGMHEVAIDEAENIIADFVAEKIGGGMLARI